MQKKETSWLERHITLHSYDDAKDERLNAASHLAGSAMSILAFVFVLFNLYRTDSVLFRSGLVIYALSNVLLYTASGLYHSLPAGDGKRICRVLDHCNIYFLIAGTYTPVLLYIGTSLAVKLTAMMWAIALVGVAFTIFFWGRLKPLHVVLYLLMGWAVVFFASDVIPLLPRHLVKYLVSGGLAYSFGVIFYAMKKIPHYHFIWHLFVLLGSALFYFGIISALLFKI